MMADAKSDPRRDADTGIDPSQFSMAGRIKAAMVHRREPVYQPEAFVEVDDSHMDAIVGGLPSHAGALYTLPLGHSIITTQAIVGNPQPIMLAPMEVPERIPYVGARRSICIQNFGTQTVFIAGSLETCTLNGWPILAGQNLILDKGVTGEIWAICAPTQSTDMRVLMELAPVDPGNAWESWEEQ